MSSNYFKSVREKIVDFLINNIGRFFTAVDIINYLELEITSRELYRHLTHIAKSLKWKYGGKYKLVMKPPMCLKCGYVFKTNKPKKPSKCPRCRSTWISEPEFAVIVD